MLASYPKSIVTEEGVSVMLRPAVSTDAQALRALFGMAWPRNGWFLRKDLTDPAVLGRWLENLDDDRELRIVAVREDDGELIGNLVLCFAPNGFRRSLAHLTITVHPEYQTAHVGFWLLWDCIKMAMSYGIDGLIVDCVPDLEEHTVNDLRKLDFFDVQTLKHYAVDSRGKDRDLLVMAKSLCEASPSFQSFGLERVRDVSQKFEKTMSYVGVRGACSQTVMQLENRWT